jgi:hypothetical protein
MVPIYCRRSDGFVAVSHAVKDDVVRHVGIPAKKVFAIHNGFDAALFRQTDDPAAIQAVRRKYQLTDHFILWAG